VRRAVSVWLWESIWLGLRVGGRGVLRRSELRRLRLLFRL
jgi:hypothetical protein